MKIEFRASEDDTVEFVVLHCVEKLLSSLMFGLGTLGLSHPRQVKLENHGYHTYYNL